jgi:hypothetical protein
MKNEQEKQTNIFILISKMNYDKNVLLNFYISMEHK